VVVVGDNEAVVTWIPDTAIRDLATDRYDAPDRPSQRRGV